MWNASFTTGQSGSVTELLSDSKGIEMDFSSKTTYRSGSPRSVGSGASWSCNYTGDILTIAFSCVVIYVFRRIELLRLGRALMIGRAEDARNNWTELGRRVFSSR